jgi:hypothetical protein
MVFLDVWRFCIVCCVPTRNICMFKSFANMVVCLGWRVLRMCILVFCVWDKVYVLLVFGHVYRMSVWSALG